MRWDFFISHKQANSSDQCHMIALGLERRGFRAWFDKFSGLDVTESGMIAGVARSRCVLLFLNAGVLSRPFVQREMSEAMRLKKPLVLVHEVDPRYGAALTPEGGFDFDSILADAPAEIRDYVRSHQSIEFRRQGDEQAAMFKRIATAARSSVRPRLLRRLSLALVAPAAGGESMLGVGWSFLVHLAWLVATLGLAAVIWMNLRGGALSNLRVDLRFGRWPTLAARVTEPPGGDVAGGGGGGGTEPWRSAPPDGPSARVGSVARQWAPASGGVLLLFGHHAARRLVWLAALSVADHFDVLLRCHRVTARGLSVLVRTIRRLALPRKAPPAPVRRSLAGRPAPPRQVGGRVGGGIAWASFSRRAALRLFRGRGL